MIIDRSPTPLESLNPLDATTFGIEINEFTFDLLIKKLYSNPIKSIVRELVSNAWDSHTAAGQTHVAVTVNAPTLFDPYFTIHDYGTGLSHEDMTTLYSTLCRSDRRDSNSFLGGFGLGSKSPFAYSDQFTVESRYNGWKRLYAIYKDANNIPTLSLMDTAATDEHNGLTVKIPVHSNDHYKFIGAIQEELLYFPHINTNTPITQPTTLWTSPDNTITLTKSTPVFSGELYAVVGQVVYRVDTNELFKGTNSLTHTYGWKGQAVYRVDTNELSKGTNFLTHTYGWKGNLFIRCEIGKLSIVPNRESLQYNATTIAHLENAIRDAKQQIHEYIKDAIPQCPTYNAACKQFGPLRSVLNSFGWWNDSYRHPEQPDEPISSYIVIPLPKGVEAAITTKSRRGPLRIDHWINKDHIKLSIDHEYDLFWCPAKTSHLAERLRHVPPTTRNGLILRGGDQDTLTELFNCELLTPVNTCDLSSYQIASRTTQRNVNTIKDLDDCAYSNSELDPALDAFLCVNQETAVHQGRSYHLWDIRNAKTTLNAFAGYRLRHIVRLTKSKWTCKLTKELPNALPLIIQRLTQLVNLYEDEIKNELLLQNASHHHKLVSLANRYRNDLRHSPFFTGLQHFQGAPTHIQNLIRTANEFRIPLPEADETQLEASNAFYQRYKPFIDYHIDLDDQPGTILLHAYEKYLEETADV